MEGKLASGVGRFRLDNRKNLCWQGSEGKVNHEVKKRERIMMCLLGPWEVILPYHCTHTTEPEMGSSASSWTRQHTLGSI